MSYDQMLEISEQIPVSRNRRLKILEQNEIDELYGLPRFSDEEREQYFAMTSLEMAALDELHSVKSKIAFIIQLGYFKARSMFFLFNSMDVAIYMQYIVERYFPYTKEINCTVTKVTRLKHHQLILSLCRYKTCEAIDRLHLQTRAQEAAMVSSKPIYVFRQILQELETHRIMIPGYTFLQDTVGQALNCEQSRLSNILRKYLTSSEECALSSLLENGSEFYNITHIKHEPNDFSVTEIKREINRGKQIRELYRLSQRILPSLKISNESVKYYASLVGCYYSVYRLKRFDSWVVYTYLLCFVHFRYQYHYDNLLMNFIFHVRKFVDAAKSAACNRANEYRIGANKNLLKAAQIIKLFTTDEVSSNTPFHEVQNKAFAILEREKLDHVAENIKRRMSFDETAFQWDHIDKLGFQFKRYLRPVLLSVDFKGAPAQTRLIEGIDFLKELFSKGRTLGQYPTHRIPTAFISDTTERYIYLREKHDKKELIPNRYEFYVCRLLRDRLEAGDVYCRDSVKFRSFEDDLVNDKTWHLKKDELIEQTGLSILKIPIEEHLATLESQIEGQIAAVNQGIASGENVSIKIKKKRDRMAWSLNYHSDDDETNHSVSDTLKQVDISSVLDFVNRRCGFMNAFEHVIGRYVKTQTDESAIAACILAWGTNTGLGRMGQVSDIGYNRLATTSDNFIRLETLKEANNCIMNAIAKLPIFLNMILVTCCILVQMVRNSKQAYLPSTLVIHLNILV